MFYRLLFSLILLVLVEGLALGQNVELVGMGAFPGDATDLSALAGTLETGTPFNQLGGFSAIEYTGEGNRYLVLSDRGPGDGAASFPCRFHEIELQLNLESRQLIPQLLKTTLLRSSQDELLSGALCAVNEFGNDGHSLALDGEGLRLLNDRTLLISEEYGPSISVFGQDGRRLKPFAIPAEFRLSASPEAPDAQGTFPNRGLEGLALSVDGRQVLSVMQGPLIQDGRIVDGKCLGLATRWLCIDRIDGSTKQFLYPLTDESSGVSEILAFDETRYLVLERDSKSGVEAKVKRIYLADVHEASDVSELASLRQTNDHDISPVSKHLLIDLLDDRFQLSGERAPEKPEGLCWGPVLPDGRRMLIVCVDNDFESNRSSEFLVFAVEP